MAMRLTILSGKIGLQNLRGIQENGAQSFQF